MYVRAVASRALELGRRGGRRSRSNQPTSVFSPSTGAGSPDADLDQDVDENGIDDPNPAANGISSGPVTLTIGGEPTSEDGNANTNLTIDFGFYPPGAIGDTVWLDYDGNGVQGPGEPGLPGVVITMVDQFGHTYTTTTDANGDYTFTGLEPGLYQVIETNPLNYVSLADADGGNPDNITVQLGLGENVVDQDLSLIHISEPTRPY